MAKVYNIIHIHWNYQDMLDKRHMEVSTTSENITEFIQELFDKSLISSSDVFEVYNGHWFVGYVQADNMEPLIKILEPGYKCIFHKTYPDLPL